MDIYKFKKLMICSKKGPRMKEGIALVWKINTWLRNQTHWRQKLENASPWTKNRLPIHSKWHWNGIASQFTLGFNWCNVAESSCHAKVKFRRKLAKEPAPPPLVFGFKRKKILDPTAPLLNPRTEQNRNFINLRVPNGTCVNHIIKITTKVFFLNPL